MEAKLFNDVRPTLRVYPTRTAKNKNNGNKLESIRWKLQPSCKNKGDVL